MPLSERHDTMHVHTTTSFGPAQLTYSCVRQPWARQATHEVSHLVSRKQVMRSNTAEEPPHLIDRLVLVGRQPFSG